MRVLCVDIGTGTQDIYLYDSRKDIENGFKLVVPAPTMMVRRKLKEATLRGQPVLLSGVTMGGGPSHWAAEDHIEAGLDLYATPDSARSFNDHLKVIEEMGVIILGQQEADALPSDVVRIETIDFDFQAIANSFASFGVSLVDLSAVAVAVFDHGAAPADYSDRKFRFDYIRERIRKNDRLSTFAFKGGEVPSRMTRLGSVVKSAGDVDAPLVVMDTAPAAVMGASLDRDVSSRSRIMVANVGNFHTLAFRLASGRIDGVFEHHTGLLDVQKLDHLLLSLANGSIRNEEVYKDSGHGAFVGEAEPLKLGPDGTGVTVTGPRRNLMTSSTLSPYFATPFGDMMLSGCFGLLASTAELLPELSGPIWSSLMGRGGSGTPPWETD
jgi:uncharacterized protein (DUF1786 family)